jgi:hypothetical protein
MTYGGQGTNKYGVHSEHHAVIHSSREPVLLPGEESRMTKPPIRVVHENPRHKLDKSSRLNFTKIYTVECNVKVWFIGKIHQDSEWSLRAAYDQEHPRLQNDIQRVPAALAQPRTTPGYPPGSSTSMYSSQPPSMSSIPSYSSGGNRDGFSSSASPYTSESM